MKRIARVLIVWLVLIAIGSEVAARVYVAAVFHSPLPANMTASHNAPAHRENMPDGLQSVHNPMQMAPNFRGESELGVVYETNALGFRDDPIEMDKIHWIFLGDSTTFGLNLTHENTYAEQVERLAKTNGLPVQSVNTGVPGRGTANEYDVLENLINNEGITPEWVIVGFFMNDVRDDYFYQNPIKPLPGILQQSVFLRLIFSFHEVSTTEWETVKSTTGTGDASILKTMPEWKATLANLERIQALTEQSGAKLLLLYIPYTETEALSGESVIADILTDYVQAHGIPFVNGAAVYHTYLAGQDTLPDGFYSSPGDMGHPGVLSSGLLAEAIYKAIMS